MLKYSENESKDRSKTAFFDMLPDDIIYNILERIEEPTDIDTLSEVCKRYAKLISRWRNAFPKKVIHNLM